MNIEQFNQLSPSEAKSVIEGCVAIAGWQQQLVAARPFLSLQQAMATARRLTEGWGSLNYVWRLVLTRGLVKRRQAVCPITLHHGLSSQRYCRPAAR